MVTNNQITIFDYVQGFLEMTLRTRSFFVPIILRREIKPGRFQLTWLKQVYHQCKTVSTDQVFA